MRTKTGEVRKRNSDNGKPFYVVRFFDLPFKNIDKYVCVPHSWIIHLFGEKAAVAYPKDEDPLTIKDRVKKKERRNGKWRFYAAYIEYKSDTFEDANNWIKTPNYDKPCDIEKSDSQPEQMLNRKLRSASRPFFSHTKLDKPSVSERPYKNPRKPLPRLLIRFPVQSRFKKNMATEQVKLDEPVKVINHSRTEPKPSKKKPSIIVIDDQLIRSAQTGIAAPSEDKSDMSELPLRNQPSPTNQVGIQAFSVPDIDIAFARDDHEDDVADRVPLVENALFPGKSPANNPETIPLSESINEKSTLRHLRLQDIPVRQSKEPNVNRTQLLQILTTPIAVTRSSSTSNQLAQRKYPQSEFLPSTSATHQNTPGLVNLISPPALLLHPLLKTKSSSATENPDSKRMCFKNMTINTSTHQDPSSSTAQVHLLDNSVVRPAPRLVHKHPKDASRLPTNNARSDFRSNAIDLSIPKQQPINNTRSDFMGDAIDLSISNQYLTTSAEQNVSYLAQHSRSLVEQSDIKQYIMMQKHHLEQIALQNSQFRQPYIGPNRYADFSNANNSEFTLQSKPNPFGQTNQLLPQHNNQYGLLNEEVQRQEILKGLISGAYTNSATITQNFGNIIQFPTQNSLNLSHYNFENLQQRQADPPRCQYLSDPSLKCNANFQKTERQVIETIQSPALLNDQKHYLLRDPRERMKPVVSGNLVGEVEPTTMNAEVQIATLPDELLPEIGIVYQNRRTKKLVVNQATEIDSIIDVDRCGDEAAESSDKSAPQVVDGECQTDEYLGEEQNSVYQETNFESEISTHDVVLNNDECADHPLDDTVGESRPPSPQHPQMQQRLAEEQEILKLYGTLITQLGASLHCTVDLLNHLRSSIIKCAELYKLLLQKIEKFNEIEKLQISTSLPNDETSRASKKNITDISSAPKMNHVQQNAFVLPPEYDPNSPKWTRKYQKKSQDSSSSHPRLMFTSANRNLKTANENPKTVER